VLVETGSALIRNPRVMQVHLGASRELTSGFSPSRLGSFSLYPERYVVRIEASVVMPPFVLSVDALPAAWHN
jgi:hypothetical protein